MLSEKINLTENPDVTLTTYILDSSKEMPNMAKRPAVLVIPGGGYSMCSDREAEPIAMAFAAQGYNTFVLRYTVGADKNFEMALHDAETALEMIYNRADEWNVLKDKVAVIGFSAGGHLAAALSTMGKVRPSACLLGYPCIIEEISEILAFPVPGLDKEVDEKTPPTFIFASSRDNVVPIKNSIKYAAALAEHKVPFEIHIFEHGWHGFSLCTPHVCAAPESVVENKHASQWIKMCIDWLTDTFSL